MSIHGADRDDVPVGSVVPAAIAAGDTTSPAMARLLGGPVLSSQNARLVAARKLTRASARRAAGQFLAEGAQAVREAIAAGVTTGLFVTSSGARRHCDLVEAALAHGIRVDLVDERAAAGLSETVTPQGLVALCPALDVPLAAALARAPALSVAVIQGNDPGNAGTVLRTADAAGAGLVVFAGTGVDPYNGKAVRATAGSLFHLDVVIEPDPAAVINSARAAGLRVLATTGSGATDLDVLDRSGALRLPTLWLMGNEAHGLPAEVLARADDTVAIPIYGRAESLNLASAAAVCLYTSARAQRLLP